MAEPDIEDAVGPYDVGPHDRPRKSLVLPKRFRGGPGGDEAAAGQAGAIPGVGTVYIRTWGCSHNSSDGEYMAGLLADYGYTITTAAAEKDTADLWLLNSCTVKTPAEHTFNNMIEEGQSKGKHIVVAGCIPQGQPRGKMVHGLSIVGVQQIDRVVEVVEETLKGRTVRLIGQKRILGRRTGGAALDLPKIRKNPLVEIVAVNSGCLNQCTYCKTKHARGDLASYPPDEICARIESVVQEEGVAEIWLTSEDTGTYGRDIGTTLPALLWRIADLLPDGCMLRVGMTNPPYILEHLEEMARIFRHPRVYEFLHLPVQSASDAVLYSMRREYTRADFERVVDYLQAEVPGITIATDIICGFPGSTEEDFQETFELVQKYRFPSLFTNQFFPRPGTPAASMEQVPKRETKDRTKRLSDLFRSYHPYSERAGKRYRVLVTETATDGKHYVAHNKFYEQVLVPQRADLLGRTIEVDIVRTGKFFMEGRVVEESIERAPVRPTPAEKGQVVRSRGRRRPAADGGASSTASSPRPARLFSELREHWVAALVALLLLIEAWRLASRS